MTNDVISDEVHATGPATRLWKPLGHLLGCMLLLPGGYGALTGQEAATQRDFEGLKASIKPAEHELAWKQIPWLTDLAEAQRLAREEQRPIFLWVTGDDPLGRC